MIPDATSYHSMADQTAANIQVAIKGSHMSPILIAQEPKSDTVRLLTRNHIHSNCKIT